MGQIKPDSISLTTHHLLMCLRETDSVLSSGTGFIFRHDEDHYLITNWHNVTGRHPETKDCLSDTKAVPNMISTMFREISQPGNCKRESIELYYDSKFLEPTWYEHPTHRSNIDVVAVPLPKVISESYELFPINKIDFDDEFKEEVADEAFVVGYPFFQSTYLELPIWKKASIASEPDVDADGLPKFYLDTATRSGLSGSPVIMQRIGIHGFIDGKPNDSSIIGRIRNLIGIYSGRMGSDEFKAQLGIVWKARVIEEIIEGKQLGSPH